MLGRIAHHRCGQLQRRCGAQLQRRFIGAHFGDPAGAIAFVDVACKPGQEADFEQLSAANAAASVREPTNARFDLLRATADPSRYVLVEAYTDAAGAAAHKDTGHYAHWREAVASMMAEPRAARHYRTLFPTCVAGLRAEGGAAGGSSSDGGGADAGVLDITHVDVEVVPGFEAAFAAVSLANAACSVREPANLRFDVLQRVDNPSRFLLVEVYVDAAGAAAHKASSHYLAWREAVAPMMARPRVGTALEALPPAQAVADGTTSAASVTAPFVPSWGGQERSGASASVAPYTLPMNDARYHPPIGFGTYKVGGTPASASAGGERARENAEDVVTAAGAEGDRFFDCGAFYENEAAVGRGLRRLLEGGADGTPPTVASREALFVTGKVWNDAVYAGPAAVRAQVMQSLEELGLTYLDLVLVHWPVPGKHVAAYDALQDLHAEGLVCGLGLSNYTVEDHEELLGAPTTTVPPLVNQIEVNPFLHRPATLRHFAEHGVVVHAYRPLGTGEAAKRMSTD